MIRHFVLAIALVVLSAVAAAQETRLVGGRTFIVHRVEAGQTLYAIARAHAVPVDALLQANPGAKDGLSIGQEVLVPKDAIVKKEARTAPEMAKDGELLHTVAKKETLFGIARLYGVDVNDLLDRNPGVDTGLREGQVVIVPTTKVKGQSDYVTKPAVQEDLIEHLVEPGETLYSLGQRYGVAPERIQALNGGLPEGLKTGQTVLVPVRTGAVPPKPVRADSVTLRQRYQVALLLPFATQRNDSAMANNPHAPRFHEPSRIAAQFYAGARMAIDSLERMGLEADVTVIDVGDDPETWGPALKRPELKRMDLFIGPFHRTAIDQLVKVNGRAHIVCPVQQTNKVILGQPTVSKVAPTRTDMVALTSRYVAQRHARDNIILLRPDIFAEKDLQDQMARSLKGALAEQATRLRDSAMVARPGRRDLGDLPGKLSGSQLNVIVVPSEDVEFITTVVGKLKPLASKYRIMLVGLESWQSMESVASLDLDALAFTFASGTFIDHGEPRTQLFTRQFRDRYHNDADEYAFLGFDVTFHYLTALMGHGTDFASHFGQVRTQPLHMGFRMMRTGPENGYRNEYAIMLQQRDLQLVKAP